MCRLLEVSTSGYYAWKNRPKSQGRIENDKLLIEIRKVYWLNDKRFGSPRIWDHLHNKLKIAVSENRIARIMKANGIMSIHKRKFKVTTNSKHDYPLWPNILNRRFRFYELNRAWVSDITYIWTQEGWMYLAVVIDLCSRNVVGLAMDRSITEELTQAALLQAILRRNPPKGLVCHSDRGSQYAGNGYKGILVKHGFIGSMSRKGDCWDNAVAESFFHTLKVELVHRYIFKTREEARRKIFEYIEIYYNRRRTHSSLGYLSPLEFENQGFPSLLTVH